MSTSTEKTEQKLLPCPFCGGANLTRIGDYIQGFCLMCMTCGARGAKTPKHEDIGTAWNTRKGGAGDE